MTLAGLSRSSPVLYLANRLPSVEILSSFSLPFIASCLSPTHSLLLAPSQSSPCALSLFALEVLFLAQLPLAASTLSIGQLPPGGIVCSAGPTKDNLVLCRDVREPLLCSALPSLSMGHHERAIAVEGHKSLTTPDPARPVVSACDAPLPLSLTAPCCC
jgi:hypothetical protein